MSRGRKVSNALSPSGAPRSKTENSPNQFSKFRESPSVGTLDRLKQNPPPFGESTVEQHTALRRRPRRREVRNRILTWVVSPKSRFFRCCCFDGDDAVVIFCRSLHLFSLHTLLLATFRTPTTTRTTLTSNLELTPLCWCRGSLISSFQSASSILHATIEFSPVRFCKLVRDKVNSSAKPHGDLHQGFTTSSRTSLP